MRGGREKLRIAATRRKQSLSARALASTLGEANAQPTGEPTRSEECLAQQRAWVVGHKSGSMKEAAPKSCQALP